MFSLNLTENDIKEWLKIAAKFRNDFNNDEQEKKELSMLYSYQACPLSIDTDKVATHISNVNNRNFKKQLTQNFYDGNLMKATSCLTNTLFLDNSVGRLSYSDKILNIYRNLRDEDIVNNDNRMKEYIHDLTIIGTPSAYGYVTASSFGDDNEINRIFAIKEPRPNVEKNELIHEAIVSMFCLNKLRDYGIPNFMQIFGVKFCSPPILDNSQRSIITYCNSPLNKNAWLIMENIEPGISYENFLKTCTPKDFIHLFIQIVVAELYAFEYYQFTHYDLHIGNIILRNLGKSSFLIKYPPLSKNSGSLYCECKTIATFIDFGRSHVKIDNNSYGYASNYRYSIFKDRGFPLGDLFHLLLLSFVCMKRDNYNCFLETCSLLNFFTNIIDEKEVRPGFNMILKMYGPDCLLPYNYKTGSVTSDEWNEFQKKYFNPNNIKYESKSMGSRYVVNEFYKYCLEYSIKKGYGSPIRTSADNNMTILNCNYQICANNVEESLRSLNIDFKSSIKPDSFIEFYDAISILDTAMEKERENVKYYGTLQGNESIYELYNRFYLESKNKKDEKSLNKIKSWYYVSNEMSNPNSKYYKKISAEFVYAVKDYEQAEKNYYQVYNYFFDNFQQAFNREKNKMNSLEKNLIPFQYISLPPSNQLFNKQTLNAMKTFLTKIATYFDSYSRIKTSIKICQYIIRTYNLKDKRSNFYQFYLHYSEMINNQSNFVKMLQTNIEKDIIKFDTYEMKQLEIQARNRLQYNPYLWYWDSYVGISNLAKLNS